MNFDTARATQLVDVIRALQEERGETINACSTLMRLKRGDLIKRIETLGAGFEITDDGNVRRVNDPPVTDAYATRAAETGQTREEAKRTTLAESYGKLDAAVDRDLAGKSEVVSEGQFVRAEKTPKERLSMPRDHVIVLLTDKNPRRPGTAAWDLWAALRSGMSVGDYCSACEKIGFGGDKSSYGPGLLNVEIRKGRMRLDPPSSGRE